MCGRCSPALAPDNDRCILQNSCLLLSSLASTRLRPIQFYQALQPAAHLHTMLVATMQLSELGVRPLLAGTRQRHRYVHIRVCLFCTAIAALLCSYQALQLASCVMCAPQASSAQLSYRDSPFSADLRRSVCLYLLIRSPAADKPSNRCPAGALTSCQPQGRTLKGSRWQLRLVSRAALMKPSGGC